jgi:ferredoxin
MAVKITDICISCGACIDECPVGAIVDDSENPTGADDSSGSIKELKKNIMGFDQFNILSENKASGGGGGGVGGGAYNSDLEKLLKGYDLMLGQLTTTKAEEAFKKISEALQPLGESFKTLFQAVQDNYPAFKDFYDKVLVPIGNWVIGTGLPSLVDCLGDIAAFFARNPELATTLISVLAALKGISLLGKVATVLNISSVGTGAGMAGTGLAGAGALGTLASWVSKGVIIPATVVVSWEVGKAIANESLTNTFATDVPGYVSPTGMPPDLMTEMLDRAARKDSEYFENAISNALYSGDLAQASGYLAVQAQYWGDTTVMWEVGLTDAEAATSKWLTMEKQAAKQLDQLNKDKLKSYRDAHNGISETMNGMPSYVKKAWDATTNTVTIATRDQSRTIQDYEAQLKSSVQITADTVQLTTAQAANTLTYQSKIATQEAAGYYGGMPSTVQGYLNSLTGNVATSTANAGSALTGGTASSTTATSEYYRNMINKVADYLTGLMSYSQRAVTNSFDTFQGMPTSVQKYLGLTWSGYKASQVITLPHFATGGFPEDGIFAANHNELVGKFDNGRTAVANNIQIIDGIRYGVAEGVLSALRSTSSNSSGVTYETLYRAVRDANKETKPAVAPIILNGREVGEAVVSWVNGRTDASGISPVKA